jgi:ligand-binding sensor domain-containing protein
MASDSTRPSAAPDAAEGPSARENLSWISSKWDPVTDAGLPLAPCTDIAFDRSGTAYVATAGGGLVTVDAAGARVWVAEDEGLPSNSLNCVAVSREGEVAVGTVRGFSYFDGEGWLESTDLERENVVACEFDDRGALWVATERSVARMAGYRASQIWHRGVDLPDVDPTCLALDAHGTTLVGTRGAGIVLIDSDGSCDVKSLRPTVYRGSNVVYNIAVTSDGSVHAATYGGRFVGEVAQLVGGSPIVACPSAERSQAVGDVAIDEIANVLWQVGDTVQSATAASGTLGVFRWVFVEEVNEDLPLEGYWYCAEVAPDGAVWFGGEHGIAVRREAGWATFSREDGLPAIRLSHLTSDVSGTIHGAFWSGVARLERGRWHVDYWHIGHPRRVIGGLSVDARGRAYVATDLGVAIEDSGEWRYLFDEEAGDTYQAFDIDVSPSDVVWVATDRGLLRGEAGDWTLFNEDHGIPTPVTEVAVGPLDRVWFHAGGCVVMIDSAHLEVMMEGVKHDLPVPLGVSAVGSAWMANMFPVIELHSDGVIDHSVGRDDGFLFSLADLYLEVTAGPGQEVWFIGMRGLAYFDGTTVKRAPLSKAAGIPASRLLSGTVDRSGDVWVSTPRGLARWRPGR